MPRYLVLLALTDQGIRNIDKSPERAAAFRKQVETAGGQVESLNWTVGQFDGAVIFQVPSDDIAASLLIKLGQRGSVRTHTLRVYEPAEFQKILLQT